MNEADCFTYKGMSLHSDHLPVIVRKKLEHKTEQQSSVSWCNTVIRANKYTILTHPKWSYLLENECDTLGEYTAATTSTIREVLEASGAKKSGNSKDRTHWSRQTLRVIKSVWKEGQPYAEHAHDYSVSQTSAPALAG